MKRRRNLQAEDLPQLTETGFFEETTEEVGRNGDRDKKNERRKARILLMLESRIDDVLKRSGYHGEVGIRVLIKDSLIIRAWPADEQSVAF